MATCKKCGSHHYGLEWVLCHDCQKTAEKEKAEARRSAAACSENPSRDQLAIAFGKWMAGYRPGVDAGWNELDQAAYDYVMEGSFISQNDQDEGSQEAK